MALDGTYRTKKIRVSKYIGEALQAGYPKWYYITGGGTTYTYDGSAVTENDLAIMIEGSIGNVPSYLDMIENFKLFVEDDEGTLDVDLTESNLPYGTDATSCPIGEQLYSIVYSTGNNDSGQLGLSDLVSRDELEVIPIGECLWASAGVSHSAIIDEDGILWMFGENGTYQLGDGTTTDNEVPAQLGVNTYTMVACGQYHTAAIDTAGLLWTWGQGANGKLGNGATTDETTPYQVGIATWSYVAVGYNHTLAIKSDGTLWACGLNTYGQLGDGTVVQRTSLVQIGTANWHKVTAGESHSAGLKPNGKLYTWGNGANGRLGNGSASSVLSPSIIQDKTTFVDVSCGGQFTLAIAKSGRQLWVTGYNGFGQLGDGTTTQQLTLTQSGLTGCYGISGGLNHSLLLKVSEKTTAEGIHRMWGSGLNTGGQLGLGDAVSVTEFTESELENAVEIRYGRMVCGGGAHSLYVRSADDPI